VRVEPGDEAAVGVVHGVVPAVAVRDGGLLVFVGSAVDDLFADVVGQDTERPIVLGLAEERAHEVVNDGFGVDMVGDFVGLRGLGVLLDEPGFDLFAGEGGRRVQGSGTQRVPGVQGGGS